MESSLSTLSHKAKAWWWFLFSLLASLALMGTTVAYTWQQPFDGLEWLSVSRRITAVELGGPADRAGLQVGDIILAVNGTPAIEVSPLYVGKQVGDRVTFSLLRQGEPEQAEITLERAPPSFLARRLTPVLIALGLWFIGIIVLTLRPAAQEARLFFVVNQVGSGVLAAGLLSTFGPEATSRLFNILLCWLSALFVHFHSIFPAPRSSHHRALRQTFGVSLFSTEPQGEAVQANAQGRLLLVRLFYGTALVLSLPFAFWSLPHLKTLSDYPLLYSGVRLFFVSALLVGMLLLFRSYLLTPSQAARQRIRWVVFGTILALTPLMVLSLLPGMLQERPLVSYELTFLFLLLIPLFYGYAIYRYNLFQTDRILNRSLVYLILALLWVGLYLNLVALLSWFFPTAIPYSLLVGALLILVMTWTLPVLQEKVQSAVGRLFYGGWYSYRTLVGRFSHALNATIEQSAVAELLVEQLPTTLQIRGAALLVSAGDGNFVPVCYKKAVTRPCDIPGRCLACEIPANGVHGNGALARHLRQEPGPLEVSRLRQALAVQDLAIGEIAHLTCTEIQVWLPLVFQGELEGILLLGSKMADDLYSNEDYRILETLAWQAATTTRNARLVKELRQQLAEIAQSRQELQEAHLRLLAGREEERKRLAREIHDEPVQKLIGISYRLRDYARQAHGSVLEGSLQELRQESLSLLKELRRICTDLRPPILDALGLTAAIRAHANEEIEGGPLITLDLTDERGLLSRDMAISLFRIYQEALANAIRHADATRITVHLEVSSDSCVLTVRDNGRGFVVPSTLEVLAKEGHLGLLGMRERAEALRGRLEVVSASGMGTEVRVWVPVNVKRNA